MCGLVAQLQPGTFPSLLWLLDRQWERPKNLDLVMDTREQFQTDEFLRYRAECKRMACFARDVRSEKIARNQLAASPWLHSADWIKQALMTFAAPQATGGAYR